MGLSATSTFVGGINDAGQIVGWFEDLFTGSHFLRDADGSLTTFDRPPGNNNTLALGVNDAGQIVGEFGDNTPARHGFLLSGGSLPPWSLISSEVRIAILEACVSGLQRNRFVAVQNEQRDGAVFFEAPFDICSAATTIIYIRPARPIGATVFRVGAREGK